MPTFVALDGGGTRTRCWIADEKRVLASACSGTVKIMNVGEQVATMRLQDLLRATAAKAGVALDSVSRTCMGLSGISSNTVRRWAETTLCATVSGEVLLRGDEEIALDAAFHDGPGILVIAGTGSHVVGRCSNGKSVTAGGWGPILGDEGSGTWIGLEAVRSGLRAHDRSVETCLLREIETFWELKDLGELVAKANHRPRPDFAELTKVVADCADGGDALAVSVLERAGEELASQVSLVASKMNAAGCEHGDTKIVAFCGSVLDKVPRVRRAMEEHLVSAMPDVKVGQTPVEPLDGAWWRARCGYR